MFLKLWKKKEINLEIWNTAIKYGVNISKFGVQFSGDSILLYNYFMINYEPFPINDTILDKFKDKCKTTSWYTYMYSFLSIRCIKVLLF